MLKAERGQAHEQEPLPSENPSKVKVADDTIGEHSRRRLQSERFC
jgi:hypothetical protein